MRDRAWSIARSLCRNIEGRLRLRIPSYPEPQTEASAAGSLDAIEALNGTLEGARAGISKAIKVKS